MNKSKVLLLLSGGKDSHKVLRLLLDAGREVHCLCINGVQEKERIEAEKVAKELNVPLDVVTIRYFDEETWNPFKLIARDLAMGLVALKLAKKVGAGELATGVKKTDTDNAQLWWLTPFLKFGTVVLRLFGIKLTFPIWDDESSPKIAPTKV